MKKIPKLFLFKAIMNLENISYINLIVDYSIEIQKELSELSQMVNNKEFL